MCERLLCGATRLQCEVWATERRRDTEERAWCACCWGEDDDDASSGMTTVAETWEQGGAVRREGAWGGWRGLRHGEKRLAGPGAGGTTRRKRVMGVLGGKVGKGKEKGENS